MTIYSASLIIKHLVSIATGGHLLYKNKLHIRFKAKAYLIKVQAPKAWTKSNQSCSDEVLYLNIMSPPNHLKSGDMLMFVFSKDFPDFKSKGRINKCADRESFLNFSFLSTDGQLPVHQNL